MGDLQNITVDRALMREAEALAGEIGLSVEEVIRQALEHGIFDMRSAQFFGLRRGKGNLEEALALLKRAGNGRPPDPGDEVPEELKHLVS